MNLDLDALEKLADAVKEYKAPDWYPSIEPPLVRVSAQTIKQLIARQRELEALCKLQHSAIVSVTNQFYHRECEEALAAYEKFNGDKE